MGRRNDGTGDQGGGTVGESQGTEAPFSEQQRQEMIRIQNAANSAHHTRMTKVMEQRFNELRESMSEQFSSLLSEQLGRLTGGGDAGKGSGKGGAGSAGAGGDDGTERIRQEYEARMAEVEKRLEAERQARVQEHERNQRQEERSKLESSLRTAGIPDERVRAAVALLYTEDKRIARAKDGSVVFQVQRDGYTDELPLEQGVEEWLKSSEGKHFAPPRDARGSGASAGSGRGQSNGRKPSRAELRKELVDAVLNSEMVR